MLVPAGTPLLTLRNKKFQGENFLTSMTLTKYQPLLFKKEQYLLGNSGEEVVKPEENNATVVEKPMDYPEVH
jgi:hypothetical protein